MRRRWICTSVAAIELCLLRAALLALLTLFNTSGLTLLTAPWTSRHHGRRSLGRAGLGKMQVWLEQGGTRQEGVDRVLGDDLLIETGQ
eukprot:3727133-Amphidinium_carterae.1